MSIYIIKNENNEEINRIVSTQEFVEAHHTGRYEEAVPAISTMSAEETARQWRDSELSSTDEAAKIPDWPNRPNILVYRQDLRDWPSTEDFPDTKPTLGE